MTAVLHVTGRWGGGIATVVQQYVESTSDLTHYLMCQDNEWSVRDRRQDLFAETLPLPDSVRAGISAVRAAIDRHGIDIVHAHSSHSGALVRLRPLPARVVYTPNAFATLAAKGSKEWISGQAERLLGVRPIVFAAAGPDEVRCAQRISPRSKVWRIYNLPDQELRPLAQYRPDLAVAMAGRISAQKDPEFYAAVAVEARNAGRPYTFRWLGDGDAQSRTVLEDAGVEVSGWLPIDKLHAEQANSQVYLHTARYEGSCLSVLDAAALGLPTIGRSVPGVRDVPWITHVDTPGKALAELDRLADADRWAESSQRSVAGVAEHDVTNLRKQLLLAYGLE